MAELDTTRKAYMHAKSVYSDLGVDTDKILEIMKTVQISMNCWEGDDVGGFERPDSVLAGGGIQATGNFPGKARTVAELRQDFEMALNFIPGRHRFNLHASYGEFGGQIVERDRVELKHYEGWMDWANRLGICLDFNCTMFSHPLAESGFTLSHKDEKIRRFWITHVEKVREIAAQMGKAQGSPCVHNIWIPDGSKDIIVDKFGHRRILKDSLDKIFETKYDPKELLDSVEGKLFGLGAEAFTVGSHDFYLGYAVTNKTMLTMDTGHFHPTESVADKISAVKPFIDNLLIHISRPVRWDSDHVVILNDDVLAVTEEIVRSNCMDRIYIALDFFDASINRIGGWVIGARSVLRGILIALLQPVEILKKLEEEGRYFERLGMLEELKMLPYGAVWDEFCRQNGVVPGRAWMDDIKKYEFEVLLKR